MNKRNRLVSKAGTFLGICLTTFLVWSNPERAAAVDAEEILSAIVGVEAEIPETARTAAFLGTERSGSGVVIDDRGLVLTIGYVILEAMGATVTDVTGASYQADIIAYDYDTGFGLLRARSPLAARPLRFGDAGAVAEGDPVLAIGFGQQPEIVAGKVSARKPFVGYWEYLLDRAIYVTPPHPSWAGIGLIDWTGRLVGIGSIRSAEASIDDSRTIGTMFVPIDLLPPILGDLLDSGRVSGPPRPWLGMFTEEDDNHIQVTMVVPDGPADKAGIVQGDVVLGIGETPVVDRASMFKEIWSRGAAGVEVPIVVGRQGRPLEISVTSADRYDYLRLDPTF